MFDFPRHRGGASADFDWIRIKLASPDEIRDWSKGEVTKPETINYRSFKPERDGLFCERIFGPVKDWECHCGKFKRIRYKGHICDKCGVEVTLSKVRRERMGHIELAVPVAHCWFFKALPSQMGSLLGMKPKDLEKVIYYAAYVVTEPGKQDVEFKQLLEEDDYLDLARKAEDEGDRGFRAEFGAEGIRLLLSPSKLDIDELAEQLRYEVVHETSKQRKQNKLKRIRVIDAIRGSADETGLRNNPEHMIMDVIPVIPPDLRPLVPLEGGRFATSDLNDLYRRVINRNNRLKKLLEMRAPEVILRNEKRMLQEAVDALFDNGRRGRAIRGRGKRPLKSLSDMLKGKQGRFRQNLLGKRVDYSGRSVIVVGPELRLHQCGLPKKMAVELFKPFIIHELERRGHSETVKRAKRLVEEDDPTVYEVLEDIIKDHPVLLNRAPTLHRLGIQAFEPVLVEGKAIRIHPLVCAAFNADFDGDAMAVHVPLSFEAQLEARVLMLSSNNILKPSNGRPIATPSQDMVLGCYYMTRVRSDFAEAGDDSGLPRFADAAEVEMALEAGYLRRKGSPDYHMPIRLLASQPDGEVEGEKKWIVTSVGRALFNAMLPRQVPYVNGTLRKDALGDLVFQSFRLAGLEETTAFLDRLKDFGFRYATHAGLSIGLDDMKIPPKKQEIIGRAQEDVNRFTQAYQRGVISFGERYNKVIDTWTHANNDVAEVMIDELASSGDGFNPIYMMFHSGARGSRDQIRQLAGMRGLMAKPQKKLTGGIGEIIESPIRSNFREGLSVLEYFISTHGARKGLADTALKTADAGYLARRLVDVAQDVTIFEEDCGTILGLDVTALKEGEDIIEPLSDRVAGNIAGEDVIDPIDDEVIVEAGEMITDRKARAIDQSGVQRVRIRSVLTCESRRGICRECYGRNLATMERVDIGEAVGILAAQSIGEPGTQLTLRTFHIGGTAARIAEQTQRRSKLEGKVEVAFERVTTVESPSEETIVTSREGELIMQTRDARVLSRLSVPYGATLHIADGVEVAKGDLLFGWDPYSEPIVADKDGLIRFIDIVREETVREELDETTGRRQQVIIEDRDKKRHPMIKIVGKRKPREFILPVGAQLLVDDKQEVRAGETLAKISREAYKTRDITGGLPRVAELFEARKPKDPATITEIDGRVSFGGIKWGKREIFVTMVDEDSDEGDAPSAGDAPAGPAAKNEQDATEMTYQVPVGKHLRVHEGDLVRAGDRLSEGPVNPHDILRVRGARAVQEYLLNEIQEVYRLQGVRINDKHIAVIVRQMLQKVRVTDPGDTEFLEGDKVDKMEFRDTAKDAVRKGKKPPRSEPALLGITKLSLTTDSFISAASFQETTRVLTDAALRGAQDKLRGLKENIISGHLVPAGTGKHRFTEIDFLVDEVLQEQIDAVRRSGAREEGSRSIFSLDGQDESGRGADGAGAEGAAAVAPRASAAGSVLGAPLAP